MGKRPGEGRYRWRGASEEEVWEGSCLLVLLGQENLTSQRKLVTREHRLSLQQKPLGEAQSLLKESAEKWGDLREAAERPWTLLT